MQFFVHYFLHKTIDKRAEKWYNFHRSNREGAVFVLGGNGALTSGRP